MPNEKRLRVNSIGGLIEDNPLTVAATTLNSAALAALPVVDTTNHCAIVLDPDGIEGAPEVAYITAHAASATVATILRAQEGATALQHSQDIPWVHAPTVKDYDGSDGGSGLIGVTSYNPGTAAYPDAPVGTTGTDIDATNLKVDFTVPPSGKVLVRLIARISTNPVVEQYWCLRDGASDVAGTAAIIHYNASAYTGSRMSHACLVTGLTPGAAKTFKWGHFKSANVAASTGYGSTAGPAVMEVWAVNL